MIDPGHQGRGRYTGVRLATQRTGWLVLGESFNRGWRASCDGRDLGRPSVIDGYANGWQLRRGCRAASFTFAPGTAVDWGYWASVIACLALVGILLLRRPGRELRAPNDGVELPAADRPEAWPLPQAALGGLAAGAVLGFAFAVRSAPFIAVAVAVILWRGLGARGPDRRGRRAARDRRADPRRARRLARPAQPALQLPGGQDHRSLGRRGGHRAADRGAVADAAGCRSPALRRAVARPAARGGGQYGQGPSRCPRARATGRAPVTIATLTATLRANHGSWASWRRR